MQQFKDLEYTRPALDAVKKEFKTHLSEFRAAGSFEKADAAMKKWNDLMARVVTQYTIAYVRNTMDTNDEFYAAEIRYYDTTLPKLMLLIKKCGKTMLASPYLPEFRKAYGEQMFKDLEIQQKLVNFRIMLPSIKENTLSTRYAKVTAGCSTEFRGEKCNFYGLLRHMQSTDREERREAFLAWSGMYERIAPELDSMYGELVRLRCKVARKLGFSNYIDYVYLSRGRYDYTKKEIEKFREAVRTYITPVCARMYAEQAERLGLSELQWYDESLVYPEGNPLPKGTPDELVEKAREMYRELSPETGEFFDFMVENQLFDLLTRDGKRQGGYCTSLPEYKAPFIFSNFNGTSADIDVLTHEAGHAFEYYYASRRLPLNDLSQSTSEINEIHSMTMEMLTYPYMDKFFGDQADRYRYAHFCDALRTIPYLVSVDEFQHRVFENPSSGPQDWRRYWREIEKKYMPWRHYEGSDFLEGGGFWMQKQHIFLFPFYYVDYALAQLGAFSLYRRQVETGDAWEHYLSLCALGGMYGYFETLEKAGIPRPLDPETVRSTAEFVSAQALKFKEKI
ncbi:MAG: M3 family oligoendopeptidase [Clostridia bacterium]|nr:M3 family oligoendopeptidase [Clostridia bacterium]